MDEPYANTEALRRGLEKAQAVIRNYAAQTGKFLAAELSKPCGEIGPPGVIRLIGGRLMRADRGGQFRAFRG